jgi:hypothetical protein
VTESINLNDEDAQFFSLFDDYTDSVELLFDLIGSEWDRLPALENDREFVLSLGAEEVVATIGAGGIITFDNPEHLKALTSNDLLTLRLYLNGDAGNILWDYAFGGGLTIDSSDNEESRLAKSFVRSPTERSIRAVWVADLRMTDTVQWKVEAASGLKEPNVLDDMGALTNSSKKEAMYGKIKSQSLRGTSVTGSGTGKYGDPWFSSVQVAGGTFNQLRIKELWFKPDLSDLSHPTWGKDENGSSVYKGTRLVNVWQRNPRLEYKVSILINGEVVKSDVVQMDDKDMIRQEFMDNLIAAGSAASSVNVPVVSIPDRDELILKNSLGSILPGFWSEAEYEYLRETHLELIANTVKAGVTAATSEVITLNNISIILSSGVELSDAMIINSGWRNPERNERVGGVPTSNHMSGRAIDIGTIYNNGSFERAKFMWALWRISQNLPGQNAINELDFRYMLEDADHSDNPNPWGTEKLAETGDTTRYLTPEVVPNTDVRGSIPQANLPDGIPDYFNFASHLHSETFGDL